MCKTLFFSLLLAAGPLVYGGSFFCPDATWPAIPISGATGGTATSCGNANVTVDGAYAATPGNGSVLASELQTYLGNNLSGATAPGFNLLEGSAVQFAGFTGPAGGKLTFDWGSQFEEGGTGTLFYLFNGSLTVLDQILPQGQGLPGATNFGSVSLTLQAGANTFAFGAVSLVDTRTQFPVTASDPAITLNNLVMTGSDVPEPGTFGLMGAGLAGLLVWMRRRAV